MFFANNNLDGMLFIFNVLDHLNKFFFPLICLFTYF